MMRFTSVLLATLLGGVLVARPATSQDWEIVDVDAFDIGQYTDVWGASASAIFITGTRGVLHFDGSQWRELTLPGGVTCCNAIWGTSSANVFAAGDGVLLRYNGSSWTEVDIGDRQSTLESTNLIDVWAGQGGGQDRVVVLGDQGRVFVKTGSDWAVSGTSVNPNLSVRGDGDSYVRTYWFPSTVLGDPYSYRAWHYDGQWRAVDRGQQPGAVFHYGWGTDLGTDQAAIVGVGNNITARYDADGNATVIDSPISSDSSFRFRDLTGAPGSIYAVGHNGFFGSVLKFTGDGWTSIGPSGPTLFTDIWGSSAGDLWALTPGTVWHFGNPVSPSAVQLVVDVMQTILEPSTFTQGKPIYLRAYVVCPGCTENLSGNASVSIDFDGFPHTISQSVSVVAGQTAADLRSDASKSFNFTIPAWEFDIDTGSVEKPVEVSLDATLGGEAISRTWERTLTVEHLRPLQVGFVAVRLRDGELVYAPTPGERKDTINHARGLYPGEVQIRYLGTLTLEVATLLAGCDACADPDPCVACNSCADDACDACRNCRACRSCVVDALLGAVSDFTVHGLFLSDAFQEVDYVFGLTPTSCGGDKRLEVGGSSDPYWFSEAALGLATFGPLRFLAHEVGHNIGLHHPAWDEVAYADGTNGVEGVCPNGTLMIRDPPGTEDYAYAWPYLDARLHTWGWDDDPTDPLKAPEKFFDFMSYCGTPFAATLRDTEEWISDTHYDRLLTNMQAPPPLVRKSDGTWAQPIGLLPAGHAPLLLAKAESVRLVHVEVAADGTVTGLSAKLASSEVTFPRGAATGGAGDYCVVSELRGSEVDRQCYPVTFLDEDRQPVDQILLTVFLRFESIDSTVRVERDGQTLAMAGGLEGFPFLTDLTVSNAKANVFEICWAGSGPAGATLTYDVFYGPDEGAQWIPLALDLPGPCHAADLDGLPSTVNGKFRVLVSDGYNTTGDTTDVTFVVDDVGPTIYLGHGSVVTDIGRDGSFRLSATAADAEDGELPLAAIVWRNAGDQVVGNGDVLVTLTGEVATYRVTATDSRNNLAMQTVTLFAGTPPPIFADGFEGDD